MSPTTPNQPKSTIAKDATELKKSIGKETRAAKNVLHDATDAAKQKVSALGSGAKDGALREAEGVKQEASAGLHAFAEAVRSAGDKLADSDQGIAGRMVREAASGLERLSSSLGKKQLEDIIDDVRDFGRKNPTAFIAGSVLAGLALGRFVRSTDDEIKPAKRARKNLSTGGENPVGSRSNPRPSGRTGRAG